MTLALIDPSAFWVMVGVGIGISGAPLAGSITAATGLLGSSVGLLLLAAAAIGTASPGCGVGLVVLPDCVGGGGASVVVVGGSVVVGRIVVVGLTSKT